MQKVMEIILIPLNVFSNYAYRVKISNFYFHFYYGKTSKEDPKNLKVSVWKWENEKLIGTVLWGLYFW